MPSIAIDSFRLVSEPWTSGAIYVSELTESLAALPEVHELILFLPRRPQRDFVYEKLLDHEKVECVYPTDEAFPESGFRSQVGWIQKRIPRLVRSLGRNIDYFVAPYHHPPIFLPKEIEIVTVIHDLCGLGIGYPKTRLGFYRHLSMLLTAYLRSDKVIPISEYTRAQLVGRFPGISSKVTAVVHNRVSHNRLANSAVVEQILGKYGLDHKPYFMAFGNPHPRKGLDLVLNSYRLFRQHAGEASLLVVVGENYRATVERMVQEQGLRDIVLVSDIESFERDALYKGALALLFPSRCEGFGYPVVEAMLQGCPPIAWQEGPVKELVSDEVSLLARLDPEKITEQMIWYAALPADARAKLASQLVEHSRMFADDGFGRKFFEAMTNTGVTER